MNWLVLILFLALIFGIMYVVVASSMVKNMI